MTDVLVVGCGLIGTSIGLALRGTGQVVALHDRDDQHVAIATQRGAGVAWDGSTARLVVVAVPPRATAETLVELQRRDVALTYTHVSSVQSHVQAEIEALSPDPSAIVGSHPLAGREVSGPGGAVQDLFVGRPWAICPANDADPRAVEAVVALAQACGGTPVHVDAHTHDEAVALLSHLPQVASSALAGLLSFSGPVVAAEALPLAGPGLADTTRLAAADTRLWTEILSLNASHVLPSVRRLVSQLDELAVALERLANEDDEQALRTITGFLARGNVGRSQVPVKRGATSDAFAVLRVELADEPGALARLFTAAGDLGVNIEDVRVEHIPGRPRGVIELVVEAEGRELLGRELAASGWVVLGA